MPLPPRRPQREPAPRPPVQEERETELVMGIRAGLAVLRYRRSDILKMAYSQQAPNEIEPLVLYSRERGFLCDEVGERELDDRAESSHHEGLLLVTKPRTWLPPAKLPGLLTAGRGVALALDRVRNPYNTGAILRTAAFLGLDAIVLGAQAPNPAVSPLAVRVAEGGAEAIPMSRTTDLAATLERLRKEGVRVVGADGASKTPAFGFSFSGPTVLVLGNEREGLALRIREQCDALIAISGTGAVESLNVGVAAGILMAEALRQRPKAARPRT